MKEDSPDMTECPKKPNVYVVNRSAHDYSDAERFGRLVYITEGNVDRYNTNTMFRLINDALEDSGPEDYIIITSLTILCSVCTSLFARKHGTLNLLLFKNGRYIERRHDLDLILQPKLSN